MHNADFILSCEKGLDKLPDKVYSISTPDKVYSAYMNEMYEKECVKMAAVYYLGCKEVETKKGDRVVAFLLCHDSYHSPVVRDFWLDDGSEIANTVRDLLPGCAVMCSTVFGNERALAQIVECPDPDIPLLDLTAFLDTSIN